MLQRFNHLIFGEKKRHRLQLDVLDGVRGLAVFFVLFSHGSGKGLILFPDLVFAGEGSGQLGVYLFFSLSAFLLTRGLIRQRDTDLKSPKLWLDYFVRRILRIYPLFTAMLILIWLGNQLGVPTTFVDFGLQDLWNHLTLQEGWHHLWTIGVEVRYYFFLPIFVLTFVFILHRNIWILTILVFALLALSSIYFPGLPEEYTYLKFFAIFLAGSYFAVINERYQVSGKKIPKRLLQIVGLISFAIMLIAMPVTYKMFFGTGHNWIRVQYFPYWGLLFGAFIFICINEQDVITRIFSHKSIRYIGIISFSMYLWHWFTLHWVVESPFHRIINMILFYSSTILISTITYLIIEKPLSRYRILARKPLVNQVPESIT